MNKINFALLLSFSLVSPVFAGGDHGQSKMGNKPSYHDRSPMEKVHQHGDKKGPIGSPAQPTYAQKSIMVGLSDDMKINFNDKLSQIKSGTVIQFIVINEGKIAHEFSIGNQAEQIEHAKMMREMPSMIHSDGNTVTVEPGKTKFLTWHFDGSDTVVFACNVPGHYEAGMFKKVALIR